MNFPAPALYCGKCPIERRGQRSALLVKIHGACVRLRERVTCLPKRDMPGHNRANVCRCG